jgi:hypothetical protein
VVGGEAGRAGQIFGDRLSVSYRFNDMPFGLLTFKDIEVIEWSIGFCWGKLILKAVVCIARWGWREVCEQFSAECGGDGIGFTEVEGEYFQHEGVEEMKDYKLDKALIQASDIHGDPPCNGGDKYVAP